MTSILIRASLQVSISNSAVTLEHPIQDIFLFIAHLVTLPFLVCCIGRDGQAGCHFACSGYIVRHRTVPSLRLFVVDVNIYKIQASLIIFIHTDIQYIRGEYVHVHDTFITQLLWEITKAIHSRTLSFRKLLHLLSIMMLN